ncbi:MAG TPA: hypothetical protein VGF13_22650 [Verrucomicrobiae bacterium]
MASYTFASEPTVPTAANLTFGQFTRANVNQDLLAGAFRSDTWNVSGAIDTAEYVSFTIQPAANRQFTFTDLAVDLVSTKKAGSHDGGPIHLDIRIFTLDGSSQLAALGDTALTANDSLKHVTWNFADLMSSAGFTVRVYGWGAENPSGALSLDNFDVNGSVTPVPEPVNVALGLFAVVALGVTAGRRALEARRA